MRTLFNELEKKDLEFMNKDVVRYIIVRALETFNGAILDDVSLCLSS